MTVSESPQPCTPPNPAGYDYINTKAYFITLVAHAGDLLFGRLENCVLSLSPCGVILHEEWLHLAEQHPYLHLDEFVIMPNHLHAILALTGAARLSASTRYLATTRQSTPAGKAHQRSHPPTSIQAWVGEYLLITTRRIQDLLNRPGRSVWQRVYQAREIHDDAELNRLRQFIRANPFTWQRDEYHPR